ncbi:MAG: lipocalin family protein [Burkholderiales bacterium]
MPPPLTVDAVDLSRYAGTWHEIARLPNVYERACVSQPSATYTPGADGIAVTNRCLTRSGRLRVSQGLARVVPGSAGSRLKVTFVPSWLRWVDAVWADYWILDLDANYQVALVGTPRRDAMWLLAREPELDDAHRGRLLRVALEQGYDVQRLQFS